LQRFFSYSGMALISKSQIKLIRSLKLKKFRDELGLFVAEGDKCIGELRRGFDMHLCFSGGDITPDQLKQLSSLTTPQGAIAVFRKPAELPLPDAADGLVLVLDGVQDPGNAGTILRTADAVGADAVVALQGSVDLFSDKTVRSAMGSHFHLPVIDGIKREDFLKYAEENKIRCFVTALDEKAQPHFNADYKGACAIVFGNEGNGASKELLDSAEHVYIPMRGQAESLNVASAAAVVLYEAFRQRYQSEASSHTK
jgi:TrmH family RNA methyltransferase